MYSKKKKKDLRSHLKFLLVIAVGCLGACQSKNALRMSDPFAYQDPSGSGFNLNRKGLSVPLSGDYIGTLKTDAGGLLPASFSLLFHRMTRNKIRGLVVLKVYHGNREHEFLSFYFPQVSFIRGHRKLILGASDSQLNVTHLRYQNSAFRGEVTLPGSNKKQAFELRYSAHLKKDLARLFSGNSTASAGGFSGSYLGICKGEQVQLELDAFSIPAKRSNQSINEVAISGGFHVNSSICQKSAKSCTIPVLAGSRADIFKQKLDLKLASRSFSCEKKDRILACGANCLLRKAPDVESHGRIVAEPSESALPLDPLGSIIENAASESVVGSYAGYLFHEGLGKYQFVRLSVVQYSDRRKPDRQWVFLGGHANLFFGSPEKQEFISYVFYPRRFVPQRKIFILDGKGEAFLAVKSWHQNGVRAWWYSKTHGRIGVLDLRKERVRAPGIRAQFLKSVSGVYRFGQKRLTVDAYPGFSLFPGDLYPMRVHGEVGRLHQGQDEEVQSVHYDFYQGFFRVVLEEGGALVVRERNSELVASLAGEKSPLQSKARWAKASHSEEVRRPLRERLSRKKRPKSKISLPIEKALSKALAPSSPSYLK